MSYASFATFLDLGQGFPTVSELVTWLMLHTLWQGLVVGGLAIFANSTMHSCSAHARYRVAVTSMLLFVLCVPATWLVSQSTPNAEGDLRSAGIQVVRGELVGSVSREHLSSLDYSPAEQASGGHPGWSTIAASCYVVGVCLMLLRLLCSWFGIQRLSHRGEAVSDQLLLARLSKLSSQVGLRRRPHLRACPSTTVPIVFGLLKPIVLLPTFVVSGMTSEELDAILLHELAHIRRGDLLVNGLQRLAESLLFFHPVTWYLSRLINTERENCCDDVVLLQCESADYANALVRLAEIVATPSQPVAALAMTGARPSQLKRRVMRILGTSDSTAFDKRGAALACVCLALIFVAVYHVQAQTDQSATDIDTSSDFVVEEPDGADSKPSTDRVNATESAILYIDVEDWKQLSERRRQRYSKFDLGNDSDEVRAIQVALSKSTSLKFQNAPLRKVVSAIQGTLGIPIAYDNAALKEKGIDVEKLLVTIDASNVSLRSALRLVLHSSKLAYLIDEDKLLITSEDTARLKLGQGAGWDDGYPLPRDNKMAGQPSKPSVLTGSRQHTIKLSRSADPGAVKVAISAYLDGKDVNEDAVSYRINSDSVVLNCSQTHFQLVDSFLTKRKWKYLSDQRRLTVELLRVSAKSAKSAIDRVFETLEADFEVTANVASNLLEITAAEDVVFRLERFAKALDAQSIKSVDKIVSRLGAGRSEELITRQYEGFRAKASNAGWVLVMNERIAEGRANFELHCVQCHGIKGNGKGTTAAFLSPPPRDFTNRRFDNVRLKNQHTISDIEKVILEGVPGTSMPSFKLLSKNQVNALAEYVSYLANDRELPKEATRSQLRFPIDVERGMMTDAYRFQKSIVVPIEVERGMMLDSIQQKRR